MRRLRLPPTGVRAWCNKHSVQLNGVEIVDLANGMGCGIISRTSVRNEGEVFITVPHQVVLNQDHVWKCAEDDSQLREVLEACVPWSKTPRGAILIYLLMQITASSPDITEQIGKQTAWTEYLKFVPDERSLPTMWSEAEKDCLWGTTLKQFLRAKLKSLQQEFDGFKTNTSSIDWCREHWWESGYMTIEDLKVVDSIYRSRTMDFVEQGICLVPVIDMANHDSGADYIGRYQIDSYTNNAILSLEWGRYIEPGYEVTITYSQDRSAADSLLSYGFIEEDMIHARSILLSLPMSDPEEDPLARPKRDCLDLTPCVLIRATSMADVTFTSPWIWAMHVNQEDGLRIRFAENEDGERELQMFFHEKRVKDESELLSAMKMDPMWDIFQLRAYAYLSDHVQGVVDDIRLLCGRSESERIPAGIDTASHAWKVSNRLRRLEYDLLVAAVHTFGDRITYLYNTEAVMRLVNDEPEYAQRAGGGCWPTGDGEYGENDESEAVNQGPSPDSHVSETSHGRGESTLSNEATDEASACDGHVPEFLNGEDKSTPSENGRVEEIVKAEASHRVTADPQSPPAIPNKPKNVVADIPIVPWVPILPIQDSEQLKKGHTDDEAPPATKPGPPRMQFTEADRRRNSEEIREKAVREIVDRLEFGPEA